MMKRYPAPMGVLGGTFDPIHYGHLRTGYELLHVLELQEVLFLPCSVPPHRGSPVASAQLRLQMLRVALAGYPGLVPDDRELHRTGPSYSVETLLDLRRDFPDHPLCLIVGMDAFLGMNSWYRWREVFELAHVVIAQRPGWTAGRMDLLETVLKERKTDNIRELHQTSAGRIYLHTVTQLEISSTAIREMVTAGREPRFLTPDPVCELIKDSGCYLGGSTTEGTSV